MKKILVFGAGKSATVLINYLLKEAELEIWKIIVIDADLSLAKSKVGNSPFAQVASFDINDEEERSRHVINADIVISLLPPHLHILVAKECLKQGRNLLTASYVDDEIKALQKEINDKGLLFLYEMGLDPGIDHMSAMQLIDEIKSKGGKIVSFQSHCGGLVSPESDDNPWHYKISWNPRNIVMAGKAGAIYKENGKKKNIEYENLFDNERLVEVPTLGVYAWYPNRDSLSYLDLYQLPDARTFVRTTLRPIDFVYGWKNIIELNLTKETPLYDSEEKTLQALLKQHLDLNNFDKWLSNKTKELNNQASSMMDNLLKLQHAEDAAKKQKASVPKSFMAADDKGKIDEINIEKLKVNGAGYMAYKMHQAKLILKQLIHLGLEDNQTIINKQKSSPADLLQFAMEQKLALQPTDKDMIVMMHEIEYVKDNRSHQIKSWLVVKGEDCIHTAMAKTVGLPLGIAAKKILNGELVLKGLQIPVAKDIYEPVLNELILHNIVFKEERK
jgi:saccharopine dehydrogenase-like NADP-dependent oxidoreductase